MKKINKKLVATAVLLTLVVSSLMFVPVMAATVANAVEDAKNGTVQATTVGTTTYVSTAAAAHDWVKVTVVDSTKDTTTSADTFTVTVKNASTSASITGGITLTETGGATDTFVGQFSAAAATSASTPSIAATDGQLIQVIHDVIVQQLNVDAKAATIGSLTTTGSITRSNTIELTGEITDAASGIANDAANADGDGVTTAEPKTNSTGHTVDIQINVDGTDRSNLATWSTITDGFRFSLLLFLAEGEHTYQVIAKDRTANSATSDSDSATTGNQTHKVTVDSTAAVLARATTGQAWDAVNKKLSANRSSVMLEFTTNGLDPDVEANADYLDAAALSTADFLVDGATISGVVFPDVKKADTASTFNKDTRHRVFLTLASDLAPNATPKISVVGTISDVAGNITPIQEKTALDGISPLLTVTITGEVASRPAVSGASGKKVTVRVVSDEALAAAPTVNFSTLTNISASPYTEVSATSAVTATAVTGLTNTWDATRAIGDAPSSGNPGLLSVRASGADSSSNTGTAGQGAAGGDDINLTTALIYEFDNEFNNGVTDTATIFNLNPASANVTETESTNPFIRIDFDGEGAEYSIGGSDSITIGTTSVEVDSHNSVTLTKVTLDDDDVISSVGSVDTNSFQVATSGLALGKHTLLVNAKDDVANTMTTDLKFEFTVVVRKEHSLGLVPGWNLVSFPGDPVDTAIDTVVSPNTAISTILTYDPADANGPWLVATRVDGSLTGTLTTIDSNHAYWVSTNTFDPIKTTLAEREFAALPPSIPLIAGWNLVPVGDLLLQTVGTELDADVYFASATWSVAYHFDASKNRWDKIVAALACDLNEATVRSSSDPGCVNIGEGWWLFTTKSGFLVP